jgi:hypothetical protein
MNQDGNAASTPAGNRMSFDPLQRAREMGPRASRMSDGMDKAALAVAHVFGSMTSNGRIT